MLLWSVCPVHGGRGGGAPSKAAAPPHLKETSEEVWTSDYDASWGHSGVCQAVDPLRED